ncbi:MAG: hypothetical protein GY950_03500 [bacterium]|nr:hypothetical protein [bacterium]
MKKIINYDPDEYQYPRILETLTENHEAPLSSIELDTRPIKNIHLAYPVLRNDKRWDTIDFTTAALFLGSALTDAGFNVSTGKLFLPGAALDDSLLNSDLLGFTLFEDLFRETEALLNKLSGAGYSGLLAAGGPMITLNPLQSARHLPQLNLLVRGEAEFVLPRLLKAINENNLDAMLEIKGFLFHVPGTLIISDFDYINRPGDFSGFRFYLDFLEKEKLGNGLEINVSRGCNRGCVFCSHVQGRTLRKLPPESFRQLLTAFSEKLAASGVTAPHAKSININDDDIFQDIGYAETIFQLIKTHDYKLWGIQTSIDSFFKPDHTIDYRTLDTAAEPALYVDGKPLVWAGTDAFLKERGKKLGKWIPSETQMLKLMEAFEERGIRNFHYWISSDHYSDWEEFVREFRFIYRLLTAYKSFGLLAHAPFLVPYPTTPVYKLLTRSPELHNRVKYKQLLKAGKKAFEFPLVDRVETGYPFLNRLLDNEKLGGGAGFFDHLKQKDYLNAFITLYNFLKQERLSFESINHAESPQLLETEKEIETFISTVI